MEHFWRTQAAGNAPYQQKGNYPFFVLHTRSQQILNALRDL